MDDSAFRIVIAIGVGVVAIAFVVQAIAMSALFRVAKAMQQRVEALIRQAEPVLAKLQPVVEKLHPVVEKAAPLVDRLIPMAEKAGVAMEKVGAAAEGASGVIATVKLIVDDNRPKVSEVCNEAVAIADTSRQQVERLGGLLTEAEGRARSRLEQIDSTIGNTVENVEQAGESIRHAVMRPVREVNGLAAGLSAAVATLVRGPRRSSVASATQDEEMFI
jgi:hypothetical protein